jgi:hypothetical protein
MAIWRATGSIKTIHFTKPYLYSYHVSATSEIDARDKLTQRVIDGKPYGVESFALKELRQLTEDEILDAMYAQAVA